MTILAVVLTLLAGHGFGLSPRLRRALALYVPVLLVLALLGYGRKRLLEIREDTERVNPLVELALERLQDKELAHHVDPVLEPNAYINYQRIEDNLAVIRSRCAHIVRLAELIVRQRLPG